MLIKITETQKNILTAADRANGLLLPPPKLPAGARQSVAKALLKNGWCYDDGPARAEDAEAAWPIDGRTRLLRITGVGMRAIGIDPDEALPGEQGEPDASGIEGSVTDSETREELRDYREAMEEGHGAHQGAQDAPQAPAATNPPAEAPAAPTAPTDAPVRDLADKAQAAIDAWGHDETQLKAALREILRAHKPAKAAKAPRQAREPGAPRQPRQGTKQDEVLAMLRRPEGATILQIADRMGWQQHTVRGFFAGLKKRQGIEVTRGADKAYRAA